MITILPEKKFKRLRGVNVERSKSENSDFPFYIFLVILFLIAYLFFNHVYFS